MGLSEGRRDQRERSIDALFDGELSDVQRRKLLADLRDDGEACREIAETRRALQLLRDMPAQPDLSAAILARVHRRRRFVPASWRPAVTVGRAAVAAGLLGVIGLYALVQRHGPSTALAPDPAPVTDLVRGAKADASEGLRAVAGLLAVGPAEPRAAVAPARRGTSEFSALESQVRSLRWSIERSGVAVGLPVHADLSGPTASSGLSVSPRSIRETVWAPRGLGILVLEDRALISLDPPSSLDAAWSWPAGVSGDVSGGAAAGGAGVGESEASLWLSERARLLP